MKNRVRQTFPTSRAGVSAILIAVLLFVFVVFAAMTVDIAYMQLIRTQLRTATDSAAIAGAEALIRTGSRDQAILAAQDYARRHEVGGVPLEISEANVVFGRGSESRWGTYWFREGATPANGMKVTGRLADGAATGPARLFFSRALGNGDFSTQLDATASAQRTEICLCIDRSYSMSWDLRLTDTADYPDADHPGLITVPSIPMAWRYYYSPQHPTGSRWSAVTVAVDIFLSRLGMSRHRPRVGLVTWAGGEYAPDRYNQLSFPLKPVTVDVPLPQPGNYVWRYRRELVRKALARLGSGPLIGGTDTYRGLQAAIAQLDGPRSSTYARKYIILLSDGENDSGKDVILAARDARNRGIEVHCINFMNTESNTLAIVARMTGGKLYIAEDVNQLRQAFQDLIQLLPVMLID